MAINLNIQNNRYMHAITDFLKLIISISLLIIIDIFVTWLVGLTITWWVELNTLFSIVIGLLLLWILPMIVMLTGIAVNLIHNWNRFMFLVSILIFLYFAAAGIAWIYESYNSFNFNDTKQAIAGTGSIIYHFVKMSYCCKRSTLGISI